MIVRFVFFFWRKNRKLETQLNIQKVLKSAQWIDKQLKHIQTKELRRTLEDFELFEEQ